MVPPQDTLVLDLGRDAVVGMPAEIGSVELMAGDADVAKIEAALVSLRRAKVTSLRLQSSVHRLPVAIADLVSLQHLTIDDPVLASLPKDLGRLQRLRDLSLKTFHLLSLPTSVGSLHRLRTLCVDSHHLAQLPKQIASLHELRELDLTFRGHSIHKDWARPYFRARFRQALPELFTQLAMLPNLRKLRLSEPPPGWCCRDPILREIPPDIGELSALEELTLARCQLAVRLPLNHLSQLRRLVLRDARLDHAPDEVAAALAHVKIEVEPGYYHEGTWVTSASLSTGRSDNDD